MNTQSSTLTNQRLIGAVLTFLLTLSNVACSGSSGSSGSSAAAAATLTEASQTVAINSSVQIAPTGGTPPYNFTLINDTIGGSLSASTGSLTTFISGSVAGTVNLEITDSAGQTVYALITVGSGTSSSGALTVTPTSTTVAPGSTDTFIATGGSGNYAYLITSGSTAGTIASNVFSALSTATSGTVVTIEAIDLSNSTLTGTTTIVVSGTATTAASCEGTFSLDLGGTGGASDPQSLSLIADSAGNVSGTMYIDGAAAPVSGTCLNGVISLTDLYMNPSTGTYVVLTGTYFTIPGTTTVFMKGTFTNNGYGYDWYAETN